jgi:hypothetical protein
MKTQLVRLIPKVTLFGAMLLFSSVGSTQAQSLSYRPKFDIPFDFVFGEKKLEAGKYAVGRALHGSDDTMLSITDQDGHAKAILLSNAVIKSRANTRAMLVFHRYGDQYFLVQVWAAGASSGREFPASRLERDVKRQIASNGAAGNVAANAKGQTVIIAAVTQ